MDRDGTIIEEKHYLSTPEEVVLIDGAAQAIRALSGRGFRIIMVSNQSGVARGLFSVDEVYKVNRRVQELLREKGAALDALYFCPHHPQGAVAPYPCHCDCRKPAPGMGLRAAAEYGIDLSRSYMVGDKPEDIAFGLNCGMKNAYLVSTGHGGEFRLAGGYGTAVKDILQAAEMILERDDGCTSRYK